MCPVSRSVCPVSDSVALPLLQDSATGVPVTLSVDPNGFFLYIVDQNKVRRGTTCDRQGIGSSALLQFSQESIVDGWLDYQLLCQIIISESPLGDPGLFSFRLRLIE